VHKEQLRGKLARLLEELRVHGGDGNSVHARRLRTEIVAARAELGDQPGMPIASADAWSDKLGANGSSRPGR
jgi:hypothetical protein